MTPIHQNLCNLFNGAPIKKSLNISIHYTEDGRAVFDLPRNPALDHALNDVHGGIIALMLDNAGWFTVAAHYQVWVVTVEFQVRLLEPANQEPLRSIGKIIRAGERMATAEMQVFGSNNRLVALGQGTFVKTSKSFTQHSAKAISPKSADPPL